jgi:hypothetical protein
MIAAALAAFVLTTHHASPEELHALKRVWLEHKAEAAHHEALEATLQGAGVVAGAVAAPATVAAAVALMTQVDPTSPALAPTEAVTLVGGCVSMCIALPVGLLVGLSRLGEAQQLAAEADARDAQLRAFDEGPMRY